LFCFPFSSIVEAADWFVSSNHGSTNTSICGTEQIPCSTVAPALAKAAYFDTIIIDDGVYAGNGNEKMYVFTPGITIKSKNGPNTVTFTGGTDFIFCFYMCYYCTIDGIKFEDNIGMAGAAIQVVQSVDFTGNNLIGDHNYAFASGGFMYATLSSGTLSNSHFSFNGFDFSGSGAFHLSDSMFTMSHCTVRHSPVTAIFIDGSGSFILHSCIVSDHHIKRYGAGLGGLNNRRIEELYISFYDTIFENNSCQAEGKLNISQLSSILVFIFQFLYLFYFVIIMPH
jgi:hypothetical protein